MSAWFHTPLILPKDIGKLTSATDNFGNKLCHPHTYFLVFGQRLIIEASLLLYLISCFITIFLTPLWLNWSEVEVPNWVQIPDDFILFTSVLRKAWIYLTLAMGSDRKTDWACLPCLVTSLGEVEFRTVEKRNGIPLHYDFDQEQPWQFAIYRCYRKGRFREPRSQMLWSDMPLKGKWLTITTECF